MKSIPPLKRTHTGKISRQLLWQSLHASYIKSTDTKREVGLLQIPKLCTANGTINRAHAPPTE